MPEKLSQFLSSVKPCSEPKILDVAGVEKNTLEKLAFVVNTGGHSIRVLSDSKER